MPEEAIKDMEAAEDFVMAALTNEPSEPIVVEKRGVALVFQRPSMVNKFRQRAWANRKLKEIGADEDEDPQITFFFRYWGTLNSFISRLLVEDKKGSITLSGKKYSDYSFDKSNELDYGSLFEKYVMEEVYNRGLSEEAFVSDVIMLHADWVSEMSKVKEDDIKNS